MPEQNPDLKINNKKELIHTFNNDEVLKKLKICSVQETEEDEFCMSINDTTKTFVYRLLKSFIDTYCLRVRDRQEVLAKHESQADKLIEYENELRILKEWNSFILMNMHKANIMDNYENTILAIERYLICELAKFTEIEDINIFHTYDYQNLLKVKNNYEIVFEELSSEVNERLNSSVQLSYECKNSYEEYQVHIIDSTSHYFVLDAGVTLPEGAKFVIKIDYKEEQEGLITNNTIQILSNVFLQTLSHFLREYYQNDAPCEQTDIFKALIDFRAAKSQNQSYTKEQRNQLIESADRIHEGLGKLETLSQGIPLRMSFDKIKAFTFRTTKIIILEKFCSIFERNNKKHAFRVWKKA